jgi:hypothetical protein
MNGNRPLLLVLLAATPLLAQEPDPAMFEPMLVPVFSSGAGAFGSQWSSTAVLRNSGGTTIKLAKPVVTNYPLCPTDPINCIGPATAELAPGALSLLDYTLQDPAGAILYIPRPALVEDDQNLNVDLRVRDLSRSTENLGTEVPVVRERNLRRTEPFELLNVDVDSRYRAAIRFYDVHGFDGEAVVVRIDNAFGQRLVDTIVHLSRPAQQSFAVDPFPLRPAYAVISDLAAQFPQLKNQIRVNVEIQFESPLSDPPYPYKHTYAFVSITNNATQMFTTVTPQ